MTAVQPGSRAAEAGLRPGDILQEIDRTPVRSPDDVRKAVAKDGKRSHLSLVLRDGHTHYVAIPPEGSEEYAAGDGTPAVRLATGAAPRQGADPALTGRGSGRRPHGGRSISSVPDPLFQSRCLAVDQCVCQCGGYSSAGGSGEAAGAA